MGSKTVSLKGRMVLLRIKLLLTTAKVALIFINIFLGLGKELMACGGDYPIATTKCSDLPRGSGDVRTPWAVTPGCLSICLNKGNECSIILYFK